MKLVDEGQLEVTDKITKFFDDVPKDKRAITIRHLLTHTSGLRDSFGNDEDPMLRDELMRRILESPLKRPVGQRYMYSNAGYSMLGAIIEKVSGMGYEAYLRDRFFDPLGMKDTGYVLPKFDKSRLAIGYAGNGRRWGTLLDYPWLDDGPYWHLRCNGGILSTLDDMYTWHRALETDVVLPQKLRDEMFEPHVQEGPESKTYYGYGWVTATTVQGTKVIEHNGGNGFFFADMYRYVDEDVCFIIFTNCGDTMESTLDLRHMARGLRTELPD